MVVTIVPHLDNKNIFDNASSYYQHLRWFKTRLTRFEYDLTRRVLLEELGNQRGGRALEIGCGPGTWTREVAPLVEHLTALDISPDMIERAREYTESENVEFVRADVAQYPFIEPVDTIFSVRVVEYLQDWRPVFERMLAAVAPGGRAIIITKTPISVWRGTGRSRAVAQLAHQVRHRYLGGPEPWRDSLWQRYIPPAEMAGLFEAHGLEQVRIRPVIYGLPIFMRGTKQYPLVPEAMEPPVLALFERGWQLADSLPPALRPAALFFSESYSISGTRPRS